MAKSLKEKIIKRREGQMSSRNTNSKKGIVSFKLSQNDLREMKKELIRNDIKKLGFDNETAKKWAGKTVKIFEEVNT